MSDFDSSGTLTTAPPPPPEVKIRTMHSDLTALAASGGNLPKFENVKVTGLSAQKESASSVARTESKSNLLLIVVLVIIVAVLAIVGWLAYLKYFAH
jgi:hypothetical protein